MSEQIDNLAGPWGAPYIDTDDVPLFAYSPAPSVERLAMGHCEHCWHPVGNRAVKLLVSGTGLCFPYLPAGNMLSYCGDPRCPEEFGGGRLFVAEGGVARPVVGPDHVMVDSSEAQPATLLFSPAYVEKAFTVAHLEIRQRLALSLTDVPAIVSLFFVVNRSDGNRWITLYDVWDLAPYIVDPSLTQRPLARKLVSAFGFGRPRGWDNSYLEAAGAGAGARVQATFKWNDEVAKKRFGLTAAVPIPRVQAIALTRNVSTVVGVPNDMLTTMLPAPDKANAGRPSVRLCTEIKFQPGPAQTQFAACVYWFGDWEEAKQGLRRLLPINMFRSNEALLWRKRARLVLESRQPNRRRMSQWESAWHSGIAHVAPWKDAKGELSVRTGGPTVFVEGAGVDERLTALSCVAQSYSAPRSAAQLLLSLGHKVRDDLEEYAHEGKGTPYFVEDMLWFLWALAEFAAASGGLADSPIQELVTELLPGIAELVTEQEHYGPSGLLTTRWADRNGLVHQLPGVPAREAGRVESVQATALLVAAVEAVVLHTVKSSPEACAELSEVAAASRDSLQKLFEGSHFPRWVLPKGRVGLKRVFLDHHVWTLIMGLPPEMEQALLHTLEQRLFKRTVVGVPTLDQPFDETAPKGAGSRFGTNLEISPLQNALLICALGRKRPSLANRLFARMGSQALLDAYPWSWGIPFLAPSRIPDPDAGSPFGPDSAERSGPDNLDGVAFEGAVAAAFARKALLGLKGVEGGIEFSVELLKHFSLSSPTLSLSQAGGGISGQWNGAGDSIRIVVRFGSKGEALQWESASQALEVYAEAGGRTIELRVKAGERWSLRKKQ